MALIAVVRLSGAAAIALVLLDVARNARPAPAPERVRNLAFSSAGRTSAPAEIWAVGDGGYPTAAAHAVAEQMRRAQPERVLYVGDVYKRGVAREFTVHFIRAGV